MKIPSKLKIGNEIYTISQLIEDQKDDYYGNSSHKYQWIKIDFRQLSEDHTGETFFHEVIHQILDHAKFTEETNNEKLVSVLANGIYQVLKDNKLLK